jgi:hypothetical protein
MLSEGHVDEVTATLKDLFWYLRSDSEGRKSWDILSLDPIAIFEELSTDEHLDERYRQKTIMPMIERLKRVRSRLWPKLAEGAFLTAPEGV